MHEEILEQKTELIFSKIASIKTISDFYLAGGTALALQFGHRKSIDLDWFSKKPFLTDKLKKELKDLGNLKIDSEEKDTLNCRLDGVRLSFFEYPYKVLFPFIKYKKIKVADFKDIACMKLEAISSRGSRKDFIDLYFLLKELSLEKVLKLFDKKYKGIEYNKLHILKSLTYFKEAEKSPLPVMIRKISWDIVKKEIQKKAKNYLKIK
ncbi:MAG: nucleotidyl transferase AbiEii/AbiGii toxin family protein [bacterium]|nr:nucleotidyl transferase AbiEii/AbiGii toxin family protein [bacterium]